MDDLLLDKSSPNPLVMATSHPVDRSDVQDGLASKRTASSNSLVDAKVRGSKNKTESSTSGKKKSNILPPKRTLDKSLKPSGARKIAKTKASRDKSPIKRKAGATKDKKPQKLSKETTKENESAQKTRPATRSATKK